MPIVRVVSVGVMQADVDAEIDLVVLRVPPTGVDDLVGICGGIDRAIGDAIINSIVTVIPEPVAKAVGPVSTAARVAHTGLRRRCSGWRWRWTVLIGERSIEHDDLIIERIVGLGMIENRFDRGAARIRRVQKRSHGLRRHIRVLGGCALNSQQKDAENKESTRVFQETCHDSNYP